MVLLLKEKNTFVQVQVSLCLIFQESEMESNFLTQVSMLPTFVSISKRRIRWIIVTTNMAFRFTDSLLHEMIFRVPSFFAIKILIKSLGLSKNFKLSTILGLAKTSFLKISCYIKN